ncbi:MAG TPA: YCF48-related protein [Candidatus Acidoferrum sp.]|nr:YCF48-related protein [Candidatus Acidoferrum sp.]
MAAEEDKKFDAVLGGFLVNHLRVGTGALHCPESDTLAAYHERSLLPEEMNSWKEHIAGCARCQAILAELEATDSIPVQPSEREEVLPGVARATAAARESIPSQKGSPLTPPAKSPVKPISRRVRWQWLAPAGALAAGLLIWVAWHGNRPLQIKTPEVTTAKLEPPVSPPSVAHNDRQSVPAEEVARASKDQGAVSETVPAEPAPEAKSLKQFEKPASRGRLSRSEPLVDKEAGARADTAVDSLAAANRGQNQPAQDAKAAVAGAMSETVEVQAPTANGQLQNQQVQQNQLNQQEISGPNPSKHLEKTKKSKSESPPLEYRAPAAPQPAPPSVMAYRDGAALKTAAAFSLRLISTPDKKALWRVGHLGMIEFSSDGGASWSRQVSNVSAELTTGSAPSEKVCWIVGQAGTILLTTDAGSHWTVVHSPLDQEDLGGVRASDALHATIWNLANTKILETSDGGVTWKPAQAQ